MTVKDIKNKVKRCFPRLYLYIKYKHYMQCSHGYILRQFIIHFRDRKTWRKEAEELRRKYNNIAIFGLFWGGRIGEILCSYLLHLSTFNEPKQFKILCSLAYREENKAVLRIMRRYIPVIMEEESVYWLYIFIKNIDMIDIEHCFQVISRTECADKTISPVWASEHFQMSGGEKQEAEEKFRRMGIQEPYVCIHNRDTAYLPANKSWHKYRNFPVSSFSVMAEELEKEGITLVRMGQATEARVDFGNCVDYANDYYDELLDVYISAHCKFWLGASSGAYLLPRIQNIPVAVINSCAVAFPAFAYIPIREDFRYIICKFYSRREKRLLSLWEMCQAVDQSGNLAENYDRMGIEVIRNTGKEIAEFAKEVNARIDGTWVETEEDRRLQEKYQLIIQRWIDFAGYNQYAVAAGRIGTHFLKNNKYLLEGAFDF